MWKNTRSSHKNIKCKTSTPTWNLGFQFELRDESYSMSGIIKTILV